MLTMQKLGNVQLHDFYCFLFKDFKKQTSVYIIPANLTKNG